MRFPRRIYSPAMIALSLRQLATLLASGSSISAALEFLEKEKGHPQSQNLWISLKKVFSGEDKNLSYRKNLVNLLPSVLQNNAPGHQKAEALRRMASGIEKSGKFKRQAFSALSPISFTFLIALGLTGVIIVYVIPVLREMYEGFGLPLPGPTLFIISLSIWIKNHFIYLLASALLLILLFSNKRLACQFGMQIPGIKILLKNTAAYNFLNAFHIMHLVDVPLAEVLHTATRSVNNAAVANKLADLFRNVSNLDQFKSQIQASEILPALFRQTFIVGISTSSLDETLCELSAFYEKEVNRIFSSIIAAIEILLFIFVSVSVGSLIIAMYLPIFKMADFIA